MSNEKPNKITWKKPSGMEIRTNDTREIIAYCESIGWKREVAESAPEPEMPRVGDEMENIPETAESAPEPVAPESGFTVAGAVGAALTAAGIRVPETLETPGSGMSDSAS